jgi:hypothetical protein
MKFGLASMKTSCSESTHQISVHAFLSSYWCFILVRYTFITGFQNNFQNHGPFRNNFYRARRLSESQNKLSEEGYWKEFYNL